MCGAWSLAACWRLRDGTVQQLLRAASQCTAAPGSTTAFAPPLARKLSPAGPPIRAPAVATAADVIGYARRSGSPKSSYTIWTTGTSPLPSSPDLNSEIRNAVQGVIEAIREISDADHHR